MLLFLISAKPFSSKEVISTPLKLTVPDEGESRVPIIFSNVLFPEPDGPTIATESPAFILRLISVKTSRWMLVPGFINVFPTLLSSIIIFVDTRYQI